MTAIKDTLNIVQVKISALNPAPYNPRKWSEDAKRHQPPGLH